MVLRCGARRAVRSTLGRAPPAAMGRTILRPHLLRHLGTFGKGLVDASWGAMDTGVAMGSGRIAILVFVAAVLWPPAAAQAQQLGPAPEGEPSRIAFQAIRGAGFSCGGHPEARRLSDGTIRATCLNGETFRIFTARGQLMALSCSAAARQGIAGC
jgi:hypothetical protein